MGSLFSQPRSDPLYLPFARAAHGRRPSDPRDWAFTGYPLSSGNTPRALAYGMYGLRPPST
jgi:hypothetical protein